MTSDPEMQKKIAEDPLWYKGGLKLNMGTLLVECVKEYITVDELAKLTMPLLIMNGDQDTVTHPHGAKVRMKQGHVPSWLREVLSCLTLLLMSLL